MYLVLGTLYLRPLHGVADDRGHGVLGDVPQ